MPIRFFPGTSSRTGRPAPTPMKTALYPSSNSSSIVMVLPTTWLHSTFTPSLSRKLTSCATISFGSLNSGIPYMRTPPGLWKASNTVTSWPLTIRSPATVSPAGPDPTTATFFPVGSALGGSSPVPFSLSQSAANRSRLPMATGSPFLARMHTPSH